MVRAGLLLLACVAGIQPYNILRERQQHACGLGHYGSPFGSAQRLVVTHLTPGVADWNIAVPMPPMCKNGLITGVDTTVCDSDVPPEVTMKDLVSARVHRKGQLNSYATVNVTVYCVLPSYADTQHADTRSTYEALSSELISNEMTSNEVTSIETVSSGLTSDELKPKKVHPITPENEATTPQTELITSTEQFTPSPKKSVQAEDKPPPAYKVTIKITPPSNAGKKKGRPHLHKLAVPSLSNKVKFSKLNAGTPPRDSMMTPQHPGMAAQYPAAQPQTAGAPPRQAGAPPQQTGALLQYQHMSAPHRPSPTKYTMPSAEYAPLSPEYEDIPPMYNMIPPPLIVAPLFRPISLLGPRVRFWLHRQPSLLLRTFGNSSIPF